MLLIYICNYTYFVQKDITMFKLWDQFCGYFGIGTEKSFFRSSNSYRVGQTGAIYLPVDAPKKIFDENPQVNQVVRKKSAMFANMNLILKDKEGNIVEDSELKKLLENPNALQSQNEFLKQYLEQKDIYGNQFIYKNVPSALQKYPSSLANISPYYLKPELTGKFFDQVDMSGIVKDYRIYNMSSGTQVFETSTILWSRIPDLDNPLIGISPLKSLQYPITNTKYAYDYLNVISNEKGAIGILSTNANKDAMGAIPMTKEEKTKLEAQYQQDYGLGEDNTGQKKMRVMLTEASINWQPMSFPTKDLLLMDQIDANFMTVIDHYGLNVNLFSSKSQTYENVRNAMIQCYQDTIIPEADQFTQALSKFIGLKDGMVLEADYSHLGILKENDAENASNFKTKSDAISQLVSANIITPLQAQEILKNELNVELDNAGKTVMDKINLVSPLIANTLLQKFTANESRELVGLPNISGGDTLPAPAPSF